MILFRIVVSLLLLVLLIEVLLEVLFALLPELFPLEALRGTRAVVGLVLLGFPLATFTMTMTITSGRGQKKVFI